MSAKDASESSALPGSDSALEDLIPTSAAVPSVAGSGDRYPRLVIVESPYAGDIERHAGYLRACLADSLGRGEAPYASHAIYPGAIDDADPIQRALGLAAGAAWRRVCSVTIVYTDLGLSAGMRDGVEDAIELGHEIEYRNLGGWR